MINRLKENFTQVNNSILNNANISLKAKWLYAFLCSKPNSWEFSYEWLMSQLLEWEKALRSAVKELVKINILLRVSKKDDKNNFNWWEWIINPTEEDLRNYIDPTMSMEVSLLGTSQEGYLNSNNKDSKKEANTSIDVLAKKSHIEEKNSTEKSKSKLSSSIRKGSKSIREIVVPPKKELVDQVLGQKRWVDKLYEIITLPNMKDYEVLALQDPDDELSFTKIVSLYEWMLAFFQEKYDGKIYKDDNGKMVGSGIILNELDKFIAYYSEKRDEDILDIKARLRKWITNSLKYAD